MCVIKDFKNLLALLLLTSWLHGTHYCGRVNGKNCLVTLKVVDLDIDFNGWFVLDVDLCCDIDFVILLKLKGFEDFE